MYSDMISKKKRVVFSKNTSMLTALESSEHSTIGHGIGLFQLAF